MHPNQKEVLFTKKFSFYGDREKENYEMEKIKYFNQVVTTLEFLGFMYTIEREGEYMTRTPYWEVTVYKNS